MKKRKYYDLIKRFTKFSIITVARLRFLILLLYRKDFITLVFMNLFNAVILKVKYHLRMNTSFVIYEHSGCMCVRLISWVPKVNSTC